MACVAASILKSVDESQKETAASLNQAFTDLDALMAKAADMVHLAETLATKVSSNTNKSADEVAAFQQYTMSLGIANPVTKWVSIDANVVKCYLLTMQRHGG